MAPIAIPVKKKRGRKAIVWSLWKELSRGFDKGADRRRRHTLSQQSDTRRKGGGRNEKGAPKGSRQFLVRRKGFEPLTF